MFISSSPLVGYFAVSHGLILKSNFSSRLPRHNSLSSYVFAFQWTLAYSIAFQRHSAKSRFLWTFILCVEHKNIPYSPWTRGGLGPRLSEHWGVAAPRKTQCTCRSQHRKRIQNMLVHFPFLFQKALGKIVTPLPTLASQTRNVI